MNFKFWQKNKDESTEVVERIEPVVNSVELPVSAGFEGSELYNLLTNGASSAAGKVVNADSAMAVSAYYACVQLLAGSVASLPLPIYKKNELGEREKITHKLSTLLNLRPCPQFSAAVFWEYMIKSIMLSGDGFALIERTRNGDIVNLIPVDPSTIYVQQVDNELRYFVFPEDKDIEAFGVHSDDMLHFPGLGFNGRRSLSPIKYYAKEALGLSMAAEEFTASFFSNGARPDFALTADKKLTTDQAETLRKTWAARHTGTTNAHLPAVLSGGLDIKQLTMSSVDSQLLEGRRFQVEEVARICGVPAHMIGETTKTSSWGSGVEHMSIGFVKYALRHHLTRIEQELKHKLFPRVKTFCEFNVEGLLRGDSKTRSEYYKAALGGSGGPGWMTINEVRKLENLPSLPDGDTITQWTMSNEKQTNTTSE